VGLRLIDDLMACVAFPYQVYAMNNDMLAVDARQQYALLVDAATGREFNLSRHATTIGRAVSCDIVLTERSVSRQHAIIYYVAGKFFIEDVGSTNGTILNGDLIKRRCQLQPGDEIQVGVTKLVFVLIPDRSAAQRVYIEGEKTVINP
jgi:pSer/pThr/pTyr-binding forkhead associated (FHA) protein